MFQSKHNPSCLSLDNVARLLLLIPLDRRNDRPANSTSSVNKLTWPGTYTSFDGIRRGIGRSILEDKGLEEHEGLEGGAVPSASR